MLCRKVCTAVNFRTRIATVWTCADEYQMELDAIDLTTE